MKYLYCLIFIILFSCNLNTQKEAQLKNYTIHYYYTVYDATLVNDIFIEAANDSLAYKMACDTFLSRTKKYFDTAKIKNSKCTIPFSFNLEGVEGNKGIKIALSKEIKNSIYNAANEKYKNVDSSKLKNWRIYVKPWFPIKIIKSWVTHNSINTPEANIVFKNLSKKKMDGIKIEIYCYNNFGDKITYGFDDYFSGISQDRLSPGRSDTYTWTLSLFDNTTKIKPFITEVHFTDGSTWNNDNL